MTPIDRLSRHFRDHENRDDLPLLVLENLARISDHAVHDELLKELVVRYATAERELSRVNALKNSFLGMAAHDLRNPLTAIRGFADLLLQGDIDEESSREFLHMIRSASQDMFQLLDDLLDVSHIESGRFSLNFAHQDIRQLALERIARLADTAARKSMTMTQELDPIDESVCDRDRIGQAMDNLLTNAIKYSPEGSEITVTLQTVPDAVRFAVSDQGPGISREEQGNLFNEFAKAGSVTTGGEKSTGLGLAIVKKIIEAHKGHVGIDSEPGKGSTFYFTLPLQQPGHNG